MHNMVTQNFKSGWYLYNQVNSHLEGWNPNLYCKLRRKAAALILGFKVKLELKCAAQYVCVWNRHFVNDQADVSKMRLQHYSTDSLF